MINKNLQFTARVSYVISSFFHLFYCSPTSSWIYLVLPSFLVQRPAHSQVDGLLPYNPHPSLYFFDFFFWYRPTPILSMKSTARNRDMGLPDRLLYSPWSNHRGPAIVLNVEAVISSCSFFYYHSLLLLLLHPAFFFISSPVAYGTRFAVLKCSRSNIKAFGWKRWDRRMGGDFFIWILGYQICVELLTALNFQ